MQIPKQIREPSTMAGAAAIVGGVNEMFQLADPAVVEAGAAAAQAIIFNPTPMGLAMAAFGVFSVFMREKGEGA